MSRSDSYMKSPKALYKKLNSLGEICFDSITFWQNERTCVMYITQVLYITQIMYFLLYFTIIRL